MKHGERRYQRKKGDQEEEKNRTVNEIEAEMD
jgi:hypothetical protein